MSDAYLKLCIAALLPVFAAILLYSVNKRTAFGKVNEKIKQVIYGLIFGALAILGTEWGIPIHGAQVNCRDAAVLIAGLMFGAPAGIISGVIGGVERWFAVAWGIGSFTRVACTLSTIIAGIYAALLRKYMFEDKKPGWLISMAIGVVMEIFHLTMVFITNMKTPTEAMAVVRACTVPMVAANGASVMLSAIALTVMSGERIWGKARNGIRISQTIQRWLLVTVLLAFAATSYFVFGLQDKIAISQTDTLLELALDEIVEDIYDTSDRNLLTKTQKVYEEKSLISLDLIAQRYDIAEISVVDSSGIITDSTERDFIGYDMASGEQSAEFLCLLSDTKTFVQEYGPISSDPSIMRKYAGIKTSTGFIQVGYDAAHFQADLAEQVVGLTKNRHVGNTGFILILDEQRNVVSAPEDLDLSAIQTKDIAVPEHNTTFTASDGA